MNKYELTAMLRKANTQRDLAECALAEFKREIYVAVSAAYEAAADMFDADAIPDFIKDLATAYGAAEGAFVCPVCKTLQPFEAGSGDCQTCDNCCKCTTYGTYCFPYGASEQQGPCDHDKYSESPFGCSQHGDDAHCWEMHCDNCDEVMLHETPKDCGEMIY